MLNAKKVDKKFWISGGWQDIERDIEWLKTENIRAILDMQYTPSDDPNLYRYVAGLVREEGILYHNILIYDGDYNYNVGELFDEGADYLEKCDKGFTDKKDRILVKCGVGASRSVAMYLNYICKRDSLDLIEAFTNLQNAEDSWALLNGGANFYPAMPDISFITYLAKKYPVQKSAFGDIERMN
jgi:hypothetical protein